MADKGAQNPTNEEILRLVQQIARDVRRLLDRK
jgi:hypothetical protein